MTALNLGLFFAAESLKKTPPTGGPWVLKVSALRDTARDGRRESMASVCLHNEYQLLCLGIRPRVFRDPERSRLFALPPLLHGTGQSAGHRFLAIRNAGPDISTISRALGITKLSLGATCAVGVDVVRAGVCDPT